MKGSWFLDFVFLAGLGMLAAGLALWDVRVMLVVVGVVLMGYALAGAWRGKR